MNSTGLQCRCNAFSKNSLLDGIVIGQHRLNCFAITNRLSRRIRHSRTGLCKRAGLVASPVINGYRVSGPKQVTRHAGTHSA